MFVFDITNHQSAADMLLIFDAILSCSWMNCKAFIFLKLRLFVDIFRDCGC